MFTRSFLRLAPMVPVLLVLLSACFVDVQHEEETQPVDDAPESLAICACDHIAAQNNAPCSCGDGVCYVNNDKPACCMGCISVAWDRDTGTPTETCVSDCPYGPCGADGFCIDY